MRLQLLDALRWKEYSVGELAEWAGLRQAKVSKHLQVLHQLGYVGRRKEGLCVQYRLADERVTDLCDIICGHIEEEATARIQALRR